MRRLVMTVATAAVAVVGGAVMAAAPVSAATAPVSAAAAPASAQLDTNASVCAAAKRTVDDGAKDIVPQLRHAADQLRQGDQSGANATVKAVGPKFANMGTQLVQVASTASDPHLKAAVTDLGNEFGKVGQSFTDVNSLREFDQSGIQAKGREVGKICGVNASPSATSGTTS